MRYNDNKSMEQNVDSQSATEFGWPQYFDEYGPPPGVVYFTFYDGGTKPKDGGGYEDIEGLTQQTITKQWEGGPYEFRDDDPFYACPKDTTVKIYGGNDAKVAASVWSTEYSDTNDDRWDRKPLANYDSTMIEADGSRLSYIGGHFYFAPDLDYRYDYGIYDIKLELVKGENTEGSITPEMYFAGEATKLKSSYETFATLEEGEYLINPLQYEGKFISQKKVGVKVTEIATKSFAHYSNGSSSYAYDWLEGIYFCPFDTSDDTNFKVTNTPSYDADEVDGNFLSLFHPSNRNIKIFLIPRRWAYTVYYRHHEWGESNATKTFTNIDCGCDNRLEIMWDTGTREHNDLYQQTYTRSTSCDADPPVQSDSSSMEAEIVNCTYYQGLFWARPPHGFRCHNFAVASSSATPETSEVPLYDSTEGVYDGSLYSSLGDSKGTQTYYGYKKLTAVKTLMTNAGIDQDTIDATYAGDTGADIHIHWDTHATDSVIKVASATAPGPLDGVKQTWYLGPIMVDGDGIYQANMNGGDPDHDEEMGVYKLWDVIEASDFWTNTIKPLRDDAIAQTGNHSIASQVDNIPFGVGISGTKAGDLVGVVVVKDQPYFVWRKTDEDLDSNLKSVGTAPDAATFHSRRADGQDEHYGLYKYQDNLTLCGYAEEWFDADYADQFKSTGGRKLTGFGRALTWNNDGNVGWPNAGVLCTSCNTTVEKGYTTSGDAETTLDMPVYVMVSKERHFDIDKLYNLDYYDPSFELGQFIYNYKRLARNIQATYTNKLAAATRNRY